MENDTKIKPCPFCGNSNIMLVGSDTRKTFLYCPKCGIKQRFRKSREEAIEAWNKRIEK